MLSLFLSTFFMQLIIQLTVRCKGLTFATEHKQSFSLNKDTVHSSVGSPGCAWCWWSSPDCWSICRPPLQKKPSSPGSSCCPWRWWRSTSPHRWDWCASWAPQTDGLYVLSRCHQWSLFGDEKQPVCFQWNKNSILTQFFKFFSSLFCFSVWAFFCNQLELSCQSFPGDTIFPQTRYCSGEVNFYHSGYKRSSFDILSTGRLLFLLAWRLLLWSFQPKDTKHCFEAVGVFTLNAFKFCSGCQTGFVFYSVLEMKKRYLKFIGENIYTMKKWQKIVLNAKNRIFKICCIMFIWCIFCMFMTLSFGFNYFNTLINCLFLSLMTDALFIWTF